MTHGSPEDARAKPLDEGILARPRTAPAAEADRARKQAGEGISLLRIDPELAIGVPLDERELACEAATVRTILVARSRWTSQLFTTAADDDWLGLYVVDGTLMRRVSTGSGTGAEVLGPGDVLRPWDEDGPYDPLPVSIAWMAMSPVRVAILDGAFARAIADWPSVLAALMARLVTRAHMLTRRHVARTSPRVDVRLLITLWFLAKRWGENDADGVVICLPLTHEMLSTLVGAQRPSTSLALDVLRRRGWVLRRARDRWLITHEGIAHLDEVADVPSAFEA